MNVIYPYMSIRRKNTIDKVKLVWINRLGAISAQKSNSDLAAQEYLAGGISLREVGTKHGVSYETVRRAIERLTP